MSVDFDVVDALAGFAEDLHSDGNFAMRLHDAVKRLKEERDEARAEVERLRLVIVTCDTAWIRRKEQGAYQRGAEAMREAAASCVGSDTALLQTYRSVLEGRIRDLPVPEDK